MKSSLSAREIRPNVQARDAYKAPSVGKHFKDFTRLAYLRVSEPGEGPPEMGRWMSRVRYSQGECSRRPFSPIRGLPRRSLKGPYPSAETGGELSSAFSRLFIWAPSGYVWR